MTGLIKEMSVKNKHIGFMTFGNVQQINIPVGQQTTTNYSVVTVVSPNMGYNASMTGAADHICNYGAANLTATYADGVLTVKPETSGGTMWGGGYVIVAAPNYNLPWGGVIPLKRFTHQRIQPTERRWAA